MVEVEAGAREPALPHPHLDVTFARNRRAFGDVHVFQLVNLSAQVTADSGRVSQGKAVSGHGQFAADAAAHIRIASEHGNAAIHLALEGDVAGANQDTAAHVTPVIYMQGLHQRVDAVAQFPVQVERIRKVCRCGLPRFRSPWFSCWQNSLNRP